MCECVPVSCAYDGKRNTTSFLTLSLWMAAVAATANEHALHVKVSDGIFGIHNKSYRRQRQISTTNTHFILNFVFYIAMACAYVAMSFVLFRFDFVFISGESSSRLLIQFCLLACLSVAPYTIYTEHTTTARNWVMRALGDA